MKIDYDKYITFIDWLVIHDGDLINDKGEYVQWNGSGTICLDGGFTSEELRQLADFMDDYGKVKNG